MSQVAAKTSTSEDGAAVIPGEQISIQSPDGEDGAFCAPADGENTRKKKRRMRVKRVTADDPSIEVVEEDDTDTDLAQVARKERPPVMFQNFA